VEGGKKERSEPTRFDLCGPKAHNIGDSECLLGGHSVGRPNILMWSSSRGGWVRMHCTA